MGGGSKKIIPRGSKKNYYEDQKKIIHVDRNASSRWNAIAFIAGKEVFLLLL